VVLEMVGIAVFERNVTMVYALPAKPLFFIKRVIMSVGVDKS